MKSQTKREIFLTTNPDAHNLDSLNEYQSYLLDDRLMESGESESEKEDKVEIIFKNKKQSKEEREKAMIMIRQEQGGNNNETHQHRIARQITVITNKNLQTKTQALVHLENLIFAPESILKITWDLICMLLILYEIVTIPLKTSFETTINYEFEIFLDLVFLTDILFSFNTAYYKNGIIIYNRKAIFKNYIKFWFWIDLISSIPYDRAVSFQSDGEDFVKYLKIVRLVRIVRLLRIAKLKVLFDKLEEQVQLSATVAFIVSFLKLSFYVLLWSHWLGCVFHYIAISQEESWLDAYDLKFEPWYNRYVISLYWAVTTMNTVGYGDISPQTTTERVYGIFFLLLATGVFSFTLNTIGSALQQVQDKKDEYTRKMKRVNHYMQSVKLPYYLKSKVRRYLSYIWDLEHPVDLYIITDQLNETLKQEFILQVNGRVLADCEFMVDIFSNKFLIEVSMIVKEMTIYPDEYIFHEYEDKYVPKHLYYISEGQVKLVLKSQQKLKTLKRGDYFGEIAFFADCPRSASARCKHFTDLFYIDRDEFQLKIKRFNKDYQKWLQIKDDINLYGEYQSLNIRCYACNQDCHVVRDCPSTHFIIDPALLVEVKEKCHSILRKQFQRRDIAYYNSRYHQRRLQKKARVIQATLLVRLEQEQKQECDAQEDELEDGTDIPIKSVMPLHHINSKFREDKKKIIHMKRYLRESRIKLQEVLQKQEETENMLKGMAIQLLGRNVAIQQLRAYTKEFFKKNRQSLKRAIYQKFQIETSKAYETPSLESDDSENSQEQGKWDDLMDEIKKKYYAQSLLTLRELNSDNDTFSKRQHFDSIPGFEKYANYKYYYPHNNLAEVLNEHVAVYENHQQLRPTEDREFSDEVFKELMSGLGITLKNQKLDRLATILKRGETFQGSDTITYKNQRRDRKRKTVLLMNLLDG